MSLPIISEGKTKIIRVAGDGEVEIESKNDITAGDGLKHDQLDGKREWSTRTTTNCFRLLEAHSIPTHYISGVNDYTFRAQRLNMLPIELVARRIATGSYLKRHPEVAEGTVFDDPLIEFFEKDDGLSPPEAKDDTLNDPLMVFDVVSQRVWRFKPKRPMAEGFIDEVPFDQIAWLTGVPSIPNLVMRLREMTQAVFRVIERSWAAQNVSLVDFKIEAGFNPGDGLVVGDVIDNDSWRIWPGGDKTQMKDKQVYRDLADDPDPAAKAKQLGKIKEDYAWVAAATDQFVP